MTQLRRLRSPGPIADAFLHSRAFICGIVGPVGSGKTLSMLQKLLRGGALQGGRPDERGIIRRKARYGVIRESYPNIEANILPSWFNLVPEAEGKFNWRAPYVHSFSKVLRRDKETGHPVDILDMDMEFRAIGDKTVEEITRGWEVNGVGVDEFDLQPPELISFLSGRVGRFSNLAPELVVDPQIVVSLNMPYIDNHAYGLLLEHNLGDLDPEKSPDLIAALNGRPLLECFVQPGGRTPSAENIHNLPGATPENPEGGRGYYAIQAAANKHRPGYVDRMIDNKPVPMQFGQPVNPQFNYSDHVRKLDYDPRFRLIVPMDQGLFAAAVAQQRLAMGELRTLRECVFMREDGKALEKIGPTAFGQALKAMLSQHFPDLSGNAVRFVADPAAFAAGDRLDNEMDWIRAVEKVLGAKIHRAKSNSPLLRNGAIWQAMDKRGGYVVDPSCKHLIRGHLGGYHYRKAELAAGATGAELRGHLEIADTIYTHVCDAEQYGALEGEHVVAKLRGRDPERRRQIVNDSHYDILGGRY
jgi:hypothetical protein